MLINSRTNLQKEKNLCGNFYFWDTFNSFEIRGFSSGRGGAGLTNKQQQQQQKEDTSMNYFTKTEYWRPLVPNVESVDGPTNPYFL